MMAGLSFVKRLMVLRRPFTLSLCSSATVNPREAIFTNAFSLFCKGKVRSPEESNVSFLKRISGEYRALSEADMEALRQAMAKHKAKFSTDDEMQRKRFLDERRHKSAEARERRMWKKLGKPSKPPLPYVLFCLEHDPTAMFKKDSHMLERWSALQDSERQRYAERRKELFKTYNQQLKEFREREDVVRIMSERAGKMREIARRKVNKVLEDKETVLCLFDVEIERLTSRIDKAVGRLEHTTADFEKLSVVVMDEAEAYEASQHGLERRIQAVEDEIDKIDSLLEHALRGELTLH